MANKDEILYKKIIKPYSVKIVSLTNKWINLFNKTLAQAKPDMRYWSAAQKELDAVYNEIEKVGVAMVSVPLPKVYSAQIVALKHDTEKRLKGFFKTRKKNVRQLINDPISLRYMQTIIANTQASFSAGISAGKKAVTNVFRDTQQKLLKDSVVQETTIIGKGLGDLKFTSATIKNQFNLLSQGQLLAIETTLKDGSKKLSYWNPSKYSELVARTQFHEMQSFAAQRTAINYGFDLVRVSSHNTTTEICQAYEGKIFSLTGKTKGFPVLPQSPPFHPNCLHNLFPESETSLQLAGTLQEYKDFTAGKKETPPKPNNFIPVGDRPKLSIKQERKLYKQIDTLEKQKEVRAQRIKNLVTGTKGYERTKKEIAAIKSKITTREVNIKKFGGWDKLGIVVQE